MDRLTFLADEHVPTVILTALRSNGYDIEPGREHLAEGAADLDLLETSTALDRVLLTNDRDFVSLGKEADHWGDRHLRRPRVISWTVRGGIRRVDRQFTPQTMRNNFEWLEDWLG